MKKTYYVPGFHARIFLWPFKIFQSKPKLAHIVLALILACGTASAATVTLKSSDASGTSSIIGATNWSNGQAPGAANDYVVGSGLVLRTPADNQTYTFGGNSLTLAGTFDFKQTNVVTIGNLQLTNGLILNAFAGGTPDVGRLAGTLNVVTNGIIDSGGNVGGTLYMQILAAITGNGGLTVRRAQMITFSGTNTYNGALNLQGTTLQIDGTGSIWPASLALQNYSVSGSQTNAYVTNIVAAGGSLNVGYGSTGFLRVGYRGSANGTNCIAVLDVSSQPQFAANVGEFSVGINQANDSLTTVGMLYLATNNIVTATNVLIADSAFTGGGISTTWLGGGSNYFNTPVMTVGGRKVTGQLTLPDGGIFRLDNAAARANFSVGSENISSSVNGVGTADLSGGDFIGTLDALTIGQKLGGSSGGDTGTLLVSSSAANNVNANTVTIGSLAGATSGSPVAQGTLTFGGGSFLVNGNLTLASYDNSGFGSAKGTLNLNGGIFSVAGNIVNGGGTSTINLNGGTLIASNMIGTAAAAITTLSITNSILQIAAAANVTNVVVTTLNTGGTDNIIQISSAPTNNYQVALPLISYVNYNGPTNFTPDLSALSSAYPNLNFTGDITTSNQVLMLNLTVHHLPVANADSFNRTAGLKLRIKITDLLANDTDADGNPITLAGINLTTTNGILLATNDTYIIYTNSANVNDQFSYTITDGYGSATGLVSIIIMTNVAGQVTGNITVNGNHQVTVGFAGIPNYSYGVQRSTNLTDWTTIWITNAPATGLFHYTDSFGDLGGTIPASAYYRLNWTP